MNHTSPTTTPTPSDSIASDFDHTGSQAEEVSVLDGTLAVPEKSNSANTTPESSPTTSGADEPHLQSTAVTSSLSETFAGSASGKRKDRDEEAGVDPRDEVGLEDQTSDEVDSLSKKRRVSSDDDTDDHQERDVISPPGPSLTNPTLEPGVAERQDKSMKAVALTGKRKDRNEDTETGPTGPFSESDVRPASATIHSSPTLSPTASTTESTEQEGNAPKKLRFDVEDPSLLNIPPSSSEGTTIVDATGSAPDVGSQQSPVSTKTSGLLKIPLELLAEILILTGSSQYVLATARTCKPLCDTLLSPDAEFIWREARKGPGCMFEVDAGKLMGLQLGNATEKKTISLPDPPKIFFGEPAYAAFVFDSGKCESCQNETSVLYHSFALRVRWCKKRTCTSVSSLIQIGTGQYGDPIMKSIVTTNEMSYFKDKDSNNPDPMWPHLYEAFCREPSLREGLEFYNKNVNDSVRLQRLIIRNSEWMKFCVQLFKWNKVRIATFKSNVAVNEFKSKMLASKYGWERGELLNTPFGPYLRYKNKVMEHIDEADVKVMQDDIESRLLVLHDKRDRRNAEVALMGTRKDVTRAYEHLRSSKTYPYLPSLATFRKLPVVDMLQSADSSTPAGTVFDTLINDKMIKELLASQLKRWADTAKNNLGVVLGFPKTWKHASKNVLHPVERVTARFLCTACKRVDVKYRDDESLDFAGACLHECAVGNKKSNRVKKGNKAIGDSKNFVKDEKAIKVLKNAVNALGFAEDRDGGNYLLTIGFALVCTSCNPPMVLDSRNIIGHSHRHDDMQCSFTTPLDDIVSYLGGFPYEYGLVQKLLGLSLPTPDVKREIDRKNYGCRHCLRESQVAEAAFSAAASDNEADNVSNDAQTTAGATGFQIELSSLAHRPHDLGMEGPHNRPPPLFNFNGMRSHLKAKHGLETIRDEDIFCFDHP